MIWGVSFTNTPGIRSELYGANADPGENQRMFDRLLSRKAEFEGVYGGTLVWDPLSGKRGFRVEVPQMTPATVEETERWPDFLEWMVISQERLRSALQSLGGAAWLAAKSPSESLAIDHDPPA